MMSTLTSESHQSVAVFVVALGVDLVHRHVVGLPNLVHALERDVVEEARGQGLLHDCVGLEGREPSRHFVGQFSLFARVRVDNHFHLLGLFRHQNDQMSEFFGCRQFSHVNAKSSSLGIFTRRQKRGILAEILTFDA